MRRHENRITSVSKRTLLLRLKDFVIPPDDVPEDVRRAITKWEQWIDYWAVDWDYHGDTFHNQWQDYRTRKKRDLVKEAKHTYDQPGEYAVMVKVIDILGNDTTKTLRVQVWSRVATDHWLRFEPQSPTLSAGLSARAADRSALRTAAAEGWRIPPESI